MEEARKVSRTAPDKRMTLDKAVAAYVHDGDTVLLVQHESPVAAVHEVCRQQKKHLTLLFDSQVGPCSMLFGLGLVDRVELAYTWGAIEGSDHIWRRVVEKKIPHEIEICHYSNYAMALRMEAGARGIPFMPLRSQIGTDIATYNPSILTMEDPYGSGDPIALVPAVQPDVAIIHAHRADKMGNVQFYGHYGNTDLAAKCAKHVIVTVEEIVTTAEIQRLPNLTLIPHYAVDAVVETPFGAHWRECFYYYHHDFPFGMKTVEQYRTEKGFLDWCDEYIFNVDDWDGYCEKVGYGRLNKLRQVERKFQTYGEVR